MQSTWLENSHRLIRTGCSYQIFSLKTKSRLGVSKDQEELSLQSGEVLALGTPEAYAKGDVGICLRALNLDSPEASRGQ